jgi:putative CocE/NonD family hydrolase
MIPMRDGVRLAANVWQPTHNGELAPGPFPALLLRTPYDKNRQVWNGDFFVKHGYIVVVQDLRGCGASEGGPFKFFIQDIECYDGYDSVEWIAQQPWCNGKVGTMGTSYAAWVQNALATQNPPHLTTMFVHEGASNAYHSALRHDGAFEMRMLGAVFLYCVLHHQNGDPALYRALEEEMTNLRSWLARFPFRRGESPLALVPQAEEGFFELYTQGDYNDFWKRPSLNPSAHYDTYADVPTYYSSAWYDPYARASLENYTNLARIKQQPKKVIIGPWIHGRNTNVTYINDVDFGPEAALVFDELQLRWFDYWLKGLDTGIMDEPPVKIFVMGSGDGRRNLEGRLNHGGHWRYGESWPLPQTQFTPYYTRAGGRLDPQPPVEPNAATTFTFDPQNPAPTITASISSLSELAPAPEGLAFDLDVWFRNRWIVRAGPSHQKEEPYIFGCKPPYLPLAARPDILVFCTDPLNEAVEVTGPVEVKLWASSSAPDTDFTAKLVDVYPPSADYPHGYHMNLCDGIIRARYRDSWESPRLMEPGQIYPITITLDPVSNIFKAGHRIRLDISSSNFPRFDVNPNTGDALGTVGRTHVAENTIYHNTEHPTYVILPIIPHGA